MGEKHCLECAKERTSRGVEGFDEWIFDILNFDWLYWEGEGSLRKGKVAILCRKGGSEKEEFLCEKYWLELANQGHPGALRGLTSGFSTF